MTKCGMTKDQWFEHVRKDETHSCEDIFCEQGCPVRKQCEDKRFILIDGVQKCVTWKERSRLVFDDLNAEMNIELIKAL